MHFCKKSFICKWRSLFWHSIHTHDHQQTRVLLSSWNQEQCGIVSYRNSFSQISLLGSNYRPSLQLMQWLLRTARFFNELIRQVTYRFTLLYVSVSEYEFGNIAYRQTMKPWRSCNISVVANNFHNLNEMDGMNEWTFVRFEFMMNFGLLSLFIVYQINCRFLVITLVKWINSTNANIRSPVVSTHIANIIRKLDF